MGQCLCCSDVKDPQKRPKLQGYPGEEPDGPADAYKLGQDQEDQEREESGVLGKDQDNLEQDNKVTSDEEPRPKSYLHNYVDIDELLGNKYVAFPIKQSASPTNTPTTKPGGGVSAVPGWTRCGGESGAKSRVGGASQVAEEEDVWLRLSFERAAARDKMTHRSENVTSSSLEKRRVCFDALPEVPTSGEAKSPISSLTPTNTTSANIASAVTNTTALAVTTFSSTGASTKVNQSSTSGLDNNKTVDQTDATPRAKRENHLDTGPIYDVPPPAKPIHSDSAPKNQPTSNHKSSALLSGLYDKLPFHISTIGSTTMPLGQTSCDKRHAFSSLRKFGVAPTGCQSNRKRRVHFDVTDSSGVLDENLRHSLDLGEVADDAQKPGIRRAVWTSEECVNSGSTIYDIPQNNTPLLKPKIGGSGGMLVRSEENLVSNAGLLSGVNALLLDQESLYDVPPEVTRDRNELGRTNVRAEERRKIGSGDYSSLDLPPVLTRGTPLLHHDPESATEALKQHEKETHKACRSLLELISASLGRKKENRPARIQEIKLACRAMKSAVQRFSDFVQNTLATATLNKSNDKRLVIGLWILYEPIQESLRRLTRSLGNLDVAQWQIKSTVAGREVDDNLLFVIRETKQIPSNIQRLSSFIQRNSILLFRAQQPTTTGVTPKPLQSPAVQQVEQNKSPKSPPQAQVTIVISRPDATTFVPKGSPNASPNQGDDINATWRHPALASPSQAEKISSDVDKSASAGYTNYDECGNIYDNLVLLREQVKKTLEEQKNDTRSRQDGQENIGGNSLPPEKPVIPQNTTASVQAISSSKVASENIQINSEKDNKSVASQDHKLMRSFSEEASCKEEIIIGNTAIASKDLHQRHEIGDSPLLTKTPAPLKPIDPLSTDSYATLIFGDDWSGLQTPPSDIWPGDLLYSPASSIADGRDTPTLNWSPSLSLDESGQFSRTDGSRLSARFRERLEKLQKEAKIPIEKLEIASTVALTKEKERRASLLEENDRQILQFYASQIQLHFDLLISAAEEFFACLDYRQPPKVFIAHSKFVILAAHKLVYIANTITCNVLNLAIRQELSRHAHALCDCLKLTANTTKKAALLFPSHAACQAMIDRVMDVTGAAKDLKGAIIKAAEL